MVYHFLSVSSLLYLSIGGFTVLAALGRVVTAARNS